MSVEQTPVTGTNKAPTWLPSRRFFAAVIAIAGMQLLATMDSTIAIVALRWCLVQGWKAAQQRCGRSAGVTRRR